MLKEKNVPFFFFFESSTDNFSVSEYKKQVGTAVVKLGNAGLAAFRPPSVMAFELTVSRSSTRGERSLFYNLPLAAVGFLPGYPWRLYHSMKCELSKP